MILAGDVGGTKVNLALCNVRSEVEIRSARRYSSSEFESLGDVLLRYFADIKVSPSEVHSACFGVPGPVLEGRCQTVNLPWVLEEAQLEKVLGITPVRLINDVEATAIGIGALRDGVELATLRPAVSGAKPSSRALIAPGTGLGEALMIWEGQKHVILPTEGGHTEFAPQDEEQVDLLRWLWPRHKHVSVEHVVSGPGIYRIYRFLKETGRELDPEGFNASLEAVGADPSKIISECALRNQHPICVHTLNLWLFCLGAEAGNLALKALSLGGIYIGGGIIPSLLKLVGTSETRGAFFEGLESKGRMSGLIQKIPVYAIKNDNAALYGAALYGAGL